LINLLGRIEKVIVSLRASILNPVARRASTQDLEKYIKYCLDFSEGLKSIIVNSQRDIASGLGIREEVWESSHSYYLQKQDGSLLIMQRRVPSKLRYLK
jgi:hypothetical protein